MSRNEVLEQIRSICDNSTINNSAKGFSKQLLAKQAVLLCKPILHDCYLEQFPKKKPTFSNNMKLSVLVIRLYAFLKYVFNVDAA